MVILKAVYIHKTGYRAQNVFFLRFRVKQGSTFMAIPIPFPMTMPIPMSPMTRWRLGRGKTILMNQ